MNKLIGMPVLIFISLFSFIAINAESLSNMHINNEALKKSYATMCYNIMMYQYTDNADANFVKTMMAHHQGAIAAAKAELKYGKDKSIRNWAKNIIKAQQSENKRAKEWLKKNR